MPRPPPHQKKKSCKSEVGLRLLLHDASLQFLATERRPGKIGSGRGAAAARGSRLPAALLRLLAAPARFRRRTYGPR